MAKRQHPPLWLATRDLHHACEAHPVGASMADASVSAEAWVQWLGALHAIHAMVDGSAAPVLRRAGQLRADLAGMAPYVPGDHVFGIAARFAAGLKREDDRAGAVYVLTGAHLMGGAIIRRRMSEAGRDLPTSHMEWADRPAALAAFQPYRDRPELGPAASATFQALLDVMDGISEGRA